MMFEILLRNLHHILGQFVNANGLWENDGNYCIYFSISDMEKILDIANLFNFNHQPLLAGLTYLGFKLNPFKYKKYDLQWMLEKLKNKIGTWTHRWLSLGGRFILVQAILQKTRTYWDFLYHTPVGIIHKYNFILENFKWEG